MIVEMPGTIGGAKIIFNDDDIDNYNIRIQEQLEMFEQEKVGIVGIGFVGKAIKNAMSSYTSLVLVDRDPSLSSHKFEDLFDCRGIFICVPSPQDDQGRCDTSILESVLAKLKGYTGVIISKCTAPPDVYEKLNEEYPNLVHAPEFLTAANADRDYLNGKFAIIGGKILAYKNEALDIIKTGQRQLDSVTFCSIGEAALAKYTINSFLATKVIFMNEMAALAHAGGQNWDVVRKCIALDTRLGTSHTQVPGPDGSFGFGGACFPKDTSALLRYAEIYNLPLNVLDSAVKKNTLLRLTEPK